ncbi:MAG: N-6 DNA methylase [Giesbergeria sp.]|uniref:Eco57I restriction-modification methylase domain-containing protein n=1 Tax=Giesbergeria sp. TaxID=2818473 RepID=UPI0026148B6A|nr:DNA methyltransferase [Giesbergeria sp.]MDD2609322.1 N-6 DNA methylase [Giesbergeria sp.]
MSNASFTVHTLKNSTTPWFRNNLLSSGFLPHEVIGHNYSPLAVKIAKWLEQHFEPEKLAAYNESQLENSFIGPLLLQLGWVTLPQQSLVVQGKQAKPDWCLLLEVDHDIILATEGVKQLKLIKAVTESKAWNKPLDNGKASKENPHHQLQDYLNTLHVRFGFLTNGRFWRIYDTENITEQKTFIEFDLEQILALPDAAQKNQALALFAFFFCRDAYVKPEDGGAQSALERLIAASREFSLAVEENLKAVIYGYEGEDSVFEVLGKAIYRASDPQQVTLEEVYENSLILLFRLLFVVYFEDKNQEILAQHRYYDAQSLQTLYIKLRTMHETEVDGYHGIFALKGLFSLLNGGAADIDIPLFNGGLFDPERAPLLLTPKILDNATLLWVLERLLFKTERGKPLLDVRRNFKFMSVTHLGRIYEGLLEFRFDKALEPATYLEYQSQATAGKVIEAYFDAYDMVKIRKEKGLKIFRELNVQSGDIYLKSASNSRKTSASYYTPSALSERLVKAGIDHALAQGKSLADIKILDNACGSGHFLVEALSYMTTLAVQRLESDAPLAALVQQERSKIAVQLKALGLPYTPDDGQILKRLLLKRCIYGVDLNPFAVELARLSLWMDSFIFGTPLSFIEHHIQHGNALLGATVQDLIAYSSGDQQQNDFFVDDLRGRFDELRQVMQTLDAMRDTTPAEVAQSKSLWLNTISPKLTLLAQVLGFISMRRMLKAEGQLAAVEAWDKTPNLLSQLFDRQSNKPSPLLEQIQAYTERYHFFHYEIAFPEAFSGEQWGFDVVMGNPPWDKTKFSDTDFFPQYHSRYRSLKNIEKSAVQQRLLGSLHVATEHQKTQEIQEVLDAYYKDKELFPLNKGAVDTNLFRLFVERNLGLLAPGGSLNYVLPSALMFEEASTALRQHILQHYQMRFFHSFENRQGLFPDVHRSYKFALMQLIKEPPLAGDNFIIDTAFYVADPAELNHQQRHVPYMLGMLKSLSPDQWALMELRDAKDLLALVKCYAAFPALSADWMNFRRELHMTHDKDLFQEQFMPGALPLVEGKMIWQYNHRFGLPQYWLDPVAFDERMRSKELHRMAQDLGVPKSEVEAHADAVRFDRNYLRLAFRAIASDTNERTLIFSLLPAGFGTGHSVFATTPKHYVLNDAGKVQVQPVSTLRLLFALAWFNSLPADWLARFMVQINVSQTYLYRLPMPQPSDEEILQNPDYQALARNALLLTFSANGDDFASSLAPAMKALGVSKKDVPTMLKAQDKLRVDIDQRVARLYGLGHDELIHLLHSFKVMAAKSPEYFTLFGVRA